jgi:hypothetical protein
VHDFSSRTSPWSFALEKERERLDDTGLADVVRAEKNTVVRKYDLPFLNAAKVLYLKLTDTHATPSNSRQAVIQSNSVICAQKTTGETSPLEGV